MKKIEKENKIKKVLKIITIIVLSITFIMSVIDVLYFIGKIDTNILNITLQEYATITKTLGYNTSIFVIPCLLFTCLIYGLLIIGIMWFIFYYVKMIKHSLNLIKNKNKKGKVLLTIYILLLICILLSIIYNLILI